ncbi:hypothetical protein [Chitinophaga tropicalis]|uniref:Uncharacterized protein n=1 Tax=Chitinophaga tropicalis TaxID=2683588 RepID=A0A7K1UAT0_9BACT|nr:hypothetical protein [Chitinophaga tropicalis]MVT11370.1 hypothetical protein [Chitinophaga tropicalis]
MTSYPFIEAFFRNVLEKSKGIQGRFHLCPRYGLEINSDQLEEVLKDDVRPDTGRKYPLVLMMPPRSQGRFTAPEGEWEKYRCVLFFLTPTYYTGNNQVKVPNKTTGTSTHTVPQDWHDMKRCAVSFLRVLDKVQIQKDLVQSTFRLGGSQDQERMIDPVSFIGSERISGIRLDFTFSLFVGCELEDYNQEDINSITIPEADPHPEHKL